MTASFTRSWVQLTTKMKPLGFSAVVFAASACGTSSSGSGYFLATGGAAGVACDPAVVNQGCNGLNVMKCDATSKTWQIQQTCVTGQYCSESVPAGGGSQHSAICQTSAVPSTGSDAGSDASSGSDTGSGGSDANNTAAQIACIKTKCSMEWNACQVYAPCKVATDCLSACTGANCDTSKCVTDGQDAKLIELIVSIGQCAETNLCVPKTTRQVVCGDGKCDPTETKLSCAADCGATSGPVCGDGKCESPETKATCAKDCGTTSGPVCGDGTCESGETKASCPADCGTSGPVCGDGKCESPETKATCAKDCGTTSGPVCGDGKCESPETKASCPADCGTSGPVCGNGTCESGETKASCPTDCGTSGGAQCGNFKCETGETAATCSVDCDPANQCIVQACPSQLQACLADSACAKAVQCVADCGTDSPCQQACLKSVGATTQQKFLSFAQCAQASGCGGAAAQCGNGTCESGETAASCPADCDMGGGGHPCDAACGGQAPSGCYCDSTCKSAGDCCDMSGQGTSKTCAGSTCGDCQ